MLPLYEITRKSICKAAFVLACLAPTVWTAGWCAWRNLPGQAEQWSAAISRETGLEVRIQAVRFPRPKTVRLIRVQVAGTKGDALILELPSLEFSEKYDPYRKRTWQAINVESATLAAGGWPQLWRGLSRSLENRGQDAFIWMVVEGIKRLNVVSSQGRGHDAQVVALKLVPTTSGLEMDARLRSVEDGTIHDASLRVRWRGPGPDVEWEADAFFDEGALSALWAEGLGSPWSDALASGEFLGGIRASGNSSSARIDKIQGTAQGVQMAPFFDGRFPPHVLRGTASIQLQELQFRNGRIETASGHLHVSAGEMSPSLLDAAAANLHWEVKPAIPSKGGVMAFDELSLMFAMKHGQLRTWGSSEEAPWVLRRGVDTLAKADPARIAPSLAIASLLAAEDAQPARVASNTTPLFQLLTAPPLDRTANRQSVQPSEQDLSGDRARR